MGSIRRLRIPEWPQFNLNLMVVEMCKGGPYYYFLPMHLAYQIGKIEATLKKGGGPGGAGFSTFELTPTNIIGTYLCKSVT